MTTTFAINKRYNAQLMSALRELRDDAEEEGFLPQTEETLELAATFTDLGDFEDSDERIVREVIEHTKDLILEKGFVVYDHLSNCDAMKLGRDDVARLMVLSAAAEYAVEKWFSKYGHNPALAEAGDDYNIVDMENLAAMLDRHVRRQLVHQHIID